MCALLGSIAVETGWTVTKSAGDFIPENFPQPTAPLPSLSTFRADYPFQDHPHRLAPAPVPGDHQFRERSSNDCRVGTDFGLPAPRRDRRRRGYLPGAHLPAQKCSTAQEGQTDQ